MVAGTWVNVGIVWDCFGCIKNMNSFFWRAIRLWNELPTEIKDAPTVPAFASGLIDILVKLFYVFIKIS